MFTHMFTFMFTFMFAFILQSRLRFNACSSSYPPSGIRRVASGTISSAEWCFWVPYIYTDLEVRDIIYTDLEVRDING